MVTSTGSWPDMLFFTTKAPRHEVVAAHVERYPLRFLVSWCLGGLIIVCMLSLTACFGTQAPAPYKHYGAQKGGSAADSAGVHTVASGDTVWGISQRYHIAMRDVIGANKLRPPYRLARGQRLKLPPPQAYRIKPGDTLYGISRTFNVSVTQLARQNHLRSPYTIHPGETLRLPSRYSVSKPASQPRQFASVAKKKSRASSSSSKQTKIAKKPIISRSTPKRAGSKFEWPVEGQLLSSYGPKKGGLHNDGVNIKAPKGTPVRAAENGVVVYAGRELKGFGNLVLVRHADRWVTAYAHMDRLHIKRGQEIKRGQTLGTVGSTGSVSVPQLHFETRRGTKALNPKKYLRKS